MIDVILYIIIAYAVAKIGFTIHKKNTDKTGDKLDEIIEHHNKLNDLYEKGEL